MLSLVALLPRYPNRLNRHRVQISTVQFVVQSIEIYTPQHPSCDGMVPQGLLGTERVSDSIRRQASEGSGCSGMGDVPATPAQTAWQCSGNMAHGCAAYGPHNTLAPTPTRLTSRGREGQRSRLAGNCYDTPDGRIRHELIRCRLLLADRKSVV